MNIPKRLKTLSSAALAALLTALCVLPAYAEPTDEDPFVPETSIEQPTEESSEVTYVSEPEQSSEEPVQVSEEISDQTSEESYEESYESQVSYEETEISDYEESSYYYEESSYIPEYSYLQESSYFHEYSYPHENSGGMTYVVDGSSTYEYSGSSYVYDNDNDTYSETYQEYYGDDDVISEPQEPERDTSSLDISDYEISDTEVLTSEDWELLKRAAQGDNSTFEFSVDKTGHADGTFKKLKEESKGGNDDWVFLVWGIVLVGAGVLSIGAVAVTTALSKKKRK